MRKVAGILLIMLFSFMGAVPHIFAAAAHLATEAEIQRMLNSQTEKVSALVSSLAALQERYGRADETERTGLDAEYQQVSEKLNALQEGFRFDLVRDQSRDNLIRLNVNGIPVLFVMEGLRVAQGLIGEQAISGFLNPPTLPGKSGSMFGPDHYKESGRLRDLIAQAQTQGRDISFAGNLPRESYDAVRAELESILAQNPTLRNAVEKTNLPEAVRSLLRDLPVLSSVETMLSQARVVDDADVTVNFVLDETNNSIPVFGRDFLTLLLRNPSHVAHAFIHEDREPVVEKILQDNGITDVTAHDVVNAIQEQMIEPSIVGRANAVYDQVLLYQKSLGVLKGAELAQDLADAGVVEAFQTLPSELQREIVQTAAQAATEPVGASLKVTPDSVVLGAVSLKAGLASAVRNLSLRARTFRDAADLTFSNIVKFFTRAAVLSRTDTAEMNMERGMLRHDIRIDAQVPDSPKAVVINLDTLGELDYAQLLNEDGTVNVEEGNLALSKVVIGLSSALAEKMRQIQEQGKKNAKFFVVSDRLPKEVLDFVIQQLDATAEQDVPTSVSYKTVDDLMDQISATFEGKALAADDVLFYVTQDNLKKYQEDTGFSKRNFYKIIQIQGAKEGERVSAAKFLIALDVLYMTKEQFEKTDLASLFREVLDDLLRTNEITQEEYDDAVRLLPAKDADTGLWLIPPVKQNSLTEQIEHSLRTSIAAAKFA